MSPISSKKSPRRLALGRETLRTLAAPPSAVDTVLVHSSCGEECGCPGTLAEPLTNPQTSY